MQFDAATYTVDGQAGERHAALGNITTTGEVGRTTGVIGDGQRCEGGSETATVARCEHGCALADANDKRTFTTLKSCSQRIRLSGRRGYSQCISHC